MNNSEYARLSLELHLFFDRIMKEHSFFLETAFMEKDTEFKRAANNFQRIFSDILDNVTMLANGKVSKKFLDSNEIVTNNTLLAENQSSNLSGIRINTDITLKELDLKSGNVNVDEGLINNISMLNRKTLPVIKNLINFKNDVLNRVLSCKLYTVNYPQLIIHIMNEAKMYYNLLLRLENKEPFTSNYIYEQELFWNKQMKEHAEFIRGLLDPAEKELIKSANNYANEYGEIMKNYSNNPSTLTDISLKETLSFKEFKTVGTEGILTCKIRSIIIPLLADHVLREANHFIRILNSGANLTK